MFLRFITLLIFILTLLYVICILTNISYEYYSNMPLLVLKVTRSNHDIYVYDSGINDYTILKDIDHVLITKHRARENEDSTLIIQMFIDVLYNEKISKIIAVLPTEQTCVFIKKKNNTIDEKLQDIILSGKVIGYLNDKHGIILQYILRSYGISNINIIKIDRITFSEKIYCCFVIQELEYKQIDFDYQVDILDCEGFDVNVLKAYVPYIKIKNKDFNKLINGYREKYSIKSCFTFDNLLIGNEYFDENKNKYIINDIHKVLDDIELINFYGMFSNKNNILETFINKVYFEPSVNIKGYYISPSLFITNTNEFDIPLQLGDVVDLRYQDRTEENGNYTIININNNVLRLEKNSMIEYIQENKTKQESSYVCIGDPSKTTQESCEINNNNIWDRPCEKNEECPFYQKNKTYNNYRGGCNDGTCELPLGMKLKGFRNYDPSVPPLCYNCPIDNIYCCNTQKNPDYMFSMDMFERLYQKGSENWYNKL